MATDIVVPQLGNEVTEAEITEWIASTGDHVKSGEVLVVISTTKTALEIESPVDGILSEILVNEGELTDFWHWKRDRHALAEACDDGYVQWEDDEGIASANGRKNDDGISPYANNQTFTDEITGMKGPKYVIPNTNNYYWIEQSQINGGTAKAVTAIALDGTITYDGGTINPNGNPDYSKYHVFFNPNKTGKRLYENFNRKRNKSETIPPNVLSSPLFLK